jgi:hypothetical protein
MAAMDLKEAPMRRHHRLAIGNPEVMNRLIAEVP